MDDTHTDNRHLESESPSSSEIASPKDDSQFHYNYVKRENYVKTADNDNYLGDKKRLAISKSRTPKKDSTWRTLDLNSGSAALAIADAFLHGPVGAKMLPLDHGSRFQTFDFKFPDSGVRAADPESTFPTSPPSSSFRASSPSNSVERSSRQIGQKERSLPETLTFNRTASQLEDERYERNERERMEEEDEEEEYSRLTATATHRGASEDRGHSKGR